MAAFDLRRTIGNLGVASVSRIACAVLAMLQFWWLTHVLGSEALGGFAFLMGLYGLVQMVPLLGLHIPLTREVALGAEPLRRAVHRYWWFAWPVALAATFVLLGYERVLGHAELRPAIWWVALALPPTAWTVIAEAVLIGRERMRVVALANLAESAWRLLSVAVAVLLGPDLSLVLLGFLSGRLLTAIVYWFALADARPDLLRAPAWAQWCSLWRGVPVYFAIAGLAALSSRLDVLMLSHSLPLSDVAHYAVAARLYEAALMLPVIVSMVILPLLARQFEHDPAVLARTVPEVMRGIFAIGLPLVLVGVALVPQVLALFFPAGFEVAAPIAQLMLFAALLATVDMVMSSVMLAARAQRRDLQTLLIGVCTLALVIAVFSPRLGALAAGLGMLVQMAVKVALRARWASGVLGVRGLAAIALRALVCVGLAVATLIAGRHRLDPMLLGPLSLVIYLGAALTTGLVRLDDLVNLSRLSPVRLSRRPR